MLTKTARCWHKNRHKHPWRIEINTHTNNHLIFDKGIKAYAAEKTVSSTSGVGKIEYPHVED
jgi:hypothetical protein